MIEMALGAASTTSASTGWPSSDTLYVAPSFSSSTTRFDRPAADSRSTSNFMAGDPVASGGHPVSNVKARPPEPGRQRNSLLRYIPNRQLRLRRQLRSLGRPRRQGGAGGRATDRARWCEYHQRETRVPRECAGTG